MEAKKPRNKERPATKTLPLLGWREWVAFPELCVSNTKAKVDTGARTSAMHAEDLDFIEVDGVAQVRFRVFPIQQAKAQAVVAQAKVVEMREIRSSDGVVTRRPVIKTDIQVGHYRWPIELTLVDRDVMGFRLLLGREAIKQRFVIDPGRSFLLGRRPKRKKPKHAA